MPQQDNGWSCYSDSLGLGDQSWAHPTNLGSANFLYMENNTFNSGFSNDRTCGAVALSCGSTPLMRQAVRRRSRLILQAVSEPSADAGRGEVYENRPNATSGSFLNALFWVSSGTGVVWGNTIPSSSGTRYKKYSFPLLNSMRSGIARPTPSPLLRMVGVIAERGQGRVAGTRILIQPDDTAWISREWGREISFKADLQRTEADQIMSATRQPESVRVQAMVEAGPTRP